MPNTLTHATITLAKPATSKSKRNHTNRRCPLAVSIKIAPFHSNQDPNSRTIWQIWRTGCPTKLLAFAIALPLVCADLSLLKPHPRPEMPVGDNNKPAFPGMPPYPTIQTGKVKAPLCLPSPGLPAGIYLHLCGIHTLTVLKLQKSKSSKELSPQPDVSLSHSLGKDKPTDFPAPMLAGLFPPDSRVVWHNRMRGTTTTCPHTHKSSHTPAAMDSPTQSDPNALGTEIICDLHLYPTPLPVSEGVQDSSSNQSRRSNFSLPFSLFQNEQDGRYKGKPFLSHFRQTSLSLSLCLCAHTWSETGAVLSDHTHPD